MHAGDSLSRGRVAIVAAVLALLTLPASGAVLDPLCVDVRLPEEYASSHPRFERIVFPTGEEATVLLPTDYESSTVQYPVLYLLHGALDNGDSWLNRTNVYEITEGAPLIVVMPDGGSWGAYTDWEDGSQSWETFHTQTLVPYVDDTYRTLADADHRAIAGYSLGGFGSLHYAFRHPDLFGLVGSFSGVVDLTHISVTVAEPVLGVAAFICGSTGQPLGPWGDPVTNADTYREHNPTDHAAEFAGRTVYFSVGTGIPCNSDDVVRLVEGTPFTELDVLLREHARNFDRALTAAGIEHDFDDYGCGIHDYPYFEKGLVGFWPHLMEAFGL